MIAMSTVHNVASIGWDVLHETNVHHEAAGCIAYDFLYSYELYTNTFALMEKC